MKRLHKNRIPINYWWGLVHDSRDMAFFIDGSHVVIMFKDGAWVLRSL